MSRVSKEYDPEKVKLSWTINGEEFVADPCKEGFITLDACVAPLKEEEVSVDTSSFEVRYCVIGAGPVGHPQKVFNRICEERGWEVVEATPHSIGDCWIFKVQCSGPVNLGYLPSYIRVL